MVQCTRNFYTNHIYVLLWCIKHARKKCGLDPIEDILRDDMQHSYKIMCIFHEAMDAMVCFLFMKSCINHYINVDILTKLYFYVFRGKRQKRQNIKIKHIKNNLC
jgi:cbb3-type cytochrome oxidase subunit 1